MKRVILYILGAVLFFSCSRSNPEPIPEKESLVRWNMVSVDGYGTKSLIVDKNSLEGACTPTDKTYSGSAGLGQTIGIWADYTIKIDEVEHEVTNVFKGTNLIYDPDNTDADTKWKYASDPAYWVLGGKYIFRAYYPANELNIISELSNAKNFVIEMNTAQTQRDMLLAFNSYDTATNTYADGTSGGEKSLDNPVPLKFHHAMSALRFLFKFYDGADGVFYSEDYLTSCWMETDADGKFAITGLMSYGTGADYSEGNIRWHEQYYPAKGISFYKWVSDGGVLFKNEVNPVNAAKPIQQVATAFTGATETGGEYIKQDGWIMIIPQISTGKLKLCFTTKAGGNAVFSVNVPEVTGTSYEKYKAEPNNQTVQKVADGKDFVPGWRYTYTVSISKTDASMELSIAPWNRLDSSFNIKF